jgi:hypothetical protein
MWQNPDTLLVHIAYRQTQRLAEANSDRLAAQARRSASRDGRRSAARLALSLPWLVLARAWSMAGSRRG